MELPPRLLQEVEAVPLIGGNLKTACGAGISSGQPLLVSHSKQQSSSQFLIAIYLVEFGMDCGRAGFLLQKSGAGQQPGLGYVVHL
jgi:hypothetical protein